MLTKTVTSNLALLDQALGTTQGVLNIVGQVVQTNTREVDSLQANTRSLAQTTQLKAKLESAQSQAHGWIRAVTWILSFGFVLLLIAQLGLGAQGLEMLRGRPVVQRTIDSHSSLQP